MRKNSEQLGPLADGQSVAIIGGGPAGIACALTLQREATKRGITLDITVFEGKRFGAHYNQCTGVLSPPLTDILQQEFDITLPSALIMREIRGYVLHGLSDAVTLDTGVDEARSLAAHRVEFDSFLETCAIARGIRVFNSRVTDLEFRTDGVMVFTWNGTFRADVVAGAFGLSRAMITTLSARTPYRPPHMMEAMATKLHPIGRIQGYIPDLLGNRIHVMLPPLPRAAFGALIPKGNHITALVAGYDVRTDDLDAFLQLAPIRRVLGGSLEPEGYFKGRFPIGLARGIAGDRYVTVGDAAGLVRPFKGKGINSAIITGTYAAETMFTHGISREAFVQYHRRCGEIIGDIPYGSLVRRLSWFAAHYGSLDVVVRQAHDNPMLQSLLYDCVSGCHTYRHIVLRPGNLGLALRLGAGVCFGGRGNDKISQSD